MRGLGKFRIAVVVFLMVILAAGCNLFGGDKLPDGTDQDPKTSEELFENTGFEDLDGSKPVRWNVLGSGDGADADPIATGAVKVASEAARTGHYGIKAELNGTGSYLISQGMPIKGGKTYEVSVWVKSEFEQGSDGRIGFKFEFIDADKKLIGPEAGGELHQYWNQSYKEWEKISWTIQTPEHAATSNIILRMYGPGWAYFDDASLVEVL